jgi:hypothetical protein
MALTQAAPLAGRRDTLTKVPRRTSDCWGPLPTSRWLRGGRIEPLDERDKVDLADPSPDAWQVDGGQLAASDQAEHGRAGDAESLSCTREGMHHRYRYGSVVSSQLLALGLRESGNRGAVRPLGPF